MAFLNQHKQFRGFGQVSRPLSELMDPITGRIVATNLTAAEMGTIQQGRIALDAARQAARDAAQAAYEATQAMVIPKIIETLSVDPITWAMITTKTDTTTGVVTTTSMDYDTGEVTTTVSPVPYEEVGPLIAKPVPYEEIHPQEWYEPTINAVMWGAIGRYLTSEELTYWVDVYKVSGSYQEFVDTVYAAVESGELVSAKPIPYTGDVPVGWISTTTDPITQVITTTYHDYDPTTDPYHPFITTIIEEDPTTETTTTTVTDTTTGEVISEEPKILWRDIPPEEPKILQKAGFDLSTSWPILAIVGAGALMMFKKEPRSGPKRKSGRRRK